MVHIFALRPSTSLITALTCVKQTMELAGMGDPTPCWYKVKKNKGTMVHATKHHFTFILYLNICSFLIPFFSFCIAANCLLFFFVFLFLLVFLCHLTYQSNNSTPLNLLSVHLLRPGKFQPYGPPFLYPYITL